MKPLDVKKEATTTNLSQLMKGLVAMCDNLYFNSIGLIEEF